jgi:carboxypeptidase D
MEIGAYRVRDGSKLEYNPGSWDEFANIIFVDNPVGTGYSFVDSNSYVHELPEMANQFVQFLEKFFALFPEYEHDDVSLTPIFQLSGPYLLRSISRENPMQANIFHTSQRRF